MTKEEEKKAMADALWLHYFNGRLYQKGTISQQEWSQMTCKIRRHSRAPVKPK